MGNTCCFELLSLSLSLFAFQSSRVRAINQVFSPRRYLGRVNELIFQFHRSRCASSLCYLSLLASPGSLTFFHFSPRERERERDVSPLRYSRANGGQKLSQRLIRLLLKRPAHFAPGSRANSRGRSLSIIESCRSFRALSSSVLEYISEWGWDERSS